MKGMDEVEDLQQDVSILRGNMRNMVNDLAQKQVLISQLGESTD